ncbi:DUF4158 domain-containing protein [Streptomyces griseocarneus]|nr:DUF4158 domain-containing protein [Streptomyces griseocarneus]MBZ6476260.1 DUF4158 domain-containing protein [Streptomyces griseocarneus]
MTDEQAARYGAFHAAPSRAKLERYFFLDDADREAVQAKRRSHNQLGFAVQRARYGAFHAAPSRAKLERYFFLDDADREAVQAKRRSHNQLGFAVQRSRRAPSGVRAAGEQVEPLPRHPLPVRSRLAHRARRLRRVHRDPPGQDRLLRARRPRPDGRRE